MSTFWKVVIGLVLTLPVAAYVTGTLVGAAAEDPERRAPIVIGDESAPGTGTDPGPGKPTATGTAKPDDPDDPDDADDVDDGPRLVRPEPVDVDDWDDAGDDDRTDADDRDDD